jgi:tyrosinase
MKKLIVFQLLLCLSLAGGAAADVEIRKNWQCLSDARKKQFVETLEIMRKRDASRDDWSHPFANSLTWYEKLHNGPGGSRPAACIHDDERFVTWHRIFLYHFERALQVASNDATMTLPYWNWTEAPTGAHYPKEFENDPLLQAKRDNAQPQKIKWTARQLTEIIDNNSTWETFAGEEGALESEPHNDMHLWVGGRSVRGPMFNDRTAATDPLFWLYHSYIDALFDRWQRQYDYAPKSSCPSCPLGDDFKSWTMLSVEKTENLGYIYDRGTCKTVAPLALSAEALPQARARLAAPQHRGGEPLFFDVAVPEEPFRIAEIRVEGVETPARVHYSGSLFLYPADVAYAPADAEFVRRYLARRFTVWSHRATEDDQHHGGPVDDVYLNITTELRYLAKTQPGGRWKAALVIDEVLPFAELTAAGTADLKKAITFDAVSLVLDRGLENDDDH